MKHTFKTPYQRFHVKLSFASNRNLYVQTLLKVELTYVLYGGNANQFAHKPLLFMLPSLSLIRLCPHLAHYFGWKWKSTNKNL